MKPCPECGETMRLAMGRWVHVAPGLCRIVTLEATTEEQERNRASSPRVREDGVVRWQRGERFRYLSTEDGKNPQGRTANEGGF